MASLSLSYRSMTSFFSGFRKHSNLSFMHTLEGLPMWDYYKNLESKPSKENALIVVNEFFRLYDGKDPQELLWFIISTALRAENEEIEARHRGNMLFFYEYCTLLFQAARILAKAEVPKPARKKKARKSDHKPSPE